MPAGRWADRLSINTELVADQSLKRLAPEKDAGVIRKAGIKLQHISYNGSAPALLAAATRLIVDPPRNAAPPSL